MFVNLLLLRISSKGCLSIDLVIIKMIKAFALTSAAIAPIMGMYGRRRTDFLSDFTYNKFHFGAFD